MQATAETKKGALMGKPKAIGKEELGLEIGMAARAYPKRSLWSRRGGF